MPTADHLSRDPGVSTADELGRCRVQFENLALASASRAPRRRDFPRRAPGAAFEHRPSGLEVFRIGVPLNRRMLVGRTFDRILTRDRFCRRCARLDRRYRFGVIEATESQPGSQAAGCRSVFLERTVIACHGGICRSQPVEGALAPVAPPRFSVELPAQTRHAAAGAERSS